jgi:putative acetyltransferase
MKIQTVTIENRAKVYALLQRAFPGSDREAGVVRKLHDNGRPLHEWVCIHTGKAIAYVAFSNAYHGRDICGLHLGPMAVAPDFHKQGVGTELLRFALRQAAIKGRPLFVLGEPGFFKRFGFEPCSQPVCPFDTGHGRFMSMGDTAAAGFVVGYEPEFNPVAALPGPGTKRRAR